MMVVPSAKSQMQVCSSNNKSFVFDNSQLERWCKFSVFFSWSFSCGLGPIRIVQIGTMKLVEYEDKLCTRMLFLPAK